MLRCESAFIQMEAAPTDNDVTDSRTLSASLYEIMDETNYSDEETPLLEELFSYEKGESGNYLMITGIAKEYRNIFWNRMKEITGKEGCLQIPEDINGIPVEEIGDNAFIGEKMIKKVDFPDSVSFIGDRAFAGNKELLAYAEENGIDSIGFFLSMEPVVRYPAQPLVLEPEVRNFFYGDLGVTRIGTRNDGVHGTRMRQHLISDIRTGSG